MVFILFMMFIEFSFRLIMIIKFKISSKVKEITKLRIKITYF